MVRKFVRDSLLYWMDEYKIDGFRFDLIGMFHRDSVVDWAKAMRAKRPDVILYGEPWTGGGPTRFGKGEQRRSGMAVFNDNFRNTFRGDLDGTAPGFALGGGASMQALQKAVMGWIDSPQAKDGFADSPQETINYVSAHDNMTLWDRVRNSIADTQPEQQRASVRLFGAVALLSQGVPFLEGGVEIGRTKGGNENSYGAGDKVNGYDWARATRFTDVLEYYRGLIALRHAHPIFRLATAKEVHRAIRFVPTKDLPEKTFAYTLNGTTAKSPYKEYLVVFHGGTEANRFILPPGEWIVLADDKRASATPSGKVQGTLMLSPLSASVLAR
jgi:pullulanase